MKRRIFGKYDGRKLVWFRLMECFLVLLTLMLLLFSFVIGVSKIDGNSMYPTLNNGQAVIYLRLDRSCDYGDIVSIRMTSGETYVKRIIGRPGDTIDLSDGVVYINGVPETGDYVNGVTLEEAGPVTYPLTLGAKQYFTIGDNREVSIDSRTYGPVSKGQIRGRILFQ